jgi:hypothetical protein
LLVEATRSFERVLAFPKSEREPPVLDQVRQKARERIAEVSPRTPRLRIRVEGAAAGVVVTVDGTPVDEAQRLAGVQVNPGHHMIAGSTPGMRAVAWLAHEGETHEAILIAPALESRSREGPMQPSAETLAALPAPGSDARAAEPGLGAVFYGGVTLAAAGALVGSAAGIKAWWDTSHARDGCTANLCPPATHERLDRADREATVANIAWAVAGAGVLVGGAGLLLRPARGVQREPAVSAVAGPGIVGVRGVF